MCVDCPMRKCVMEKKSSHCAECNDYPCQYIEDYVPTESDNRKALEELAQQSWSVLLAVYGETGDEYDALPHALICGGSGGGKTYFIFPVYHSSSAIPEAFRPWREFSGVRYR